MAVSPVSRALISVSDKQGLIPFARFLAERGVEILSTGGTASHLRENQIEVVDVSDYTGFPELFEGRVKTLHPKVHGGLLFRREEAEDVKQAGKNDIPPIDLLIVNLYPFEETIRKPDVSLDEAIKQIDIGGPAMLRSAAKNYKSVAVACCPEDYPAIMEEMKGHDGEITGAMREKLAIKVFQSTAAYDRAIADFLNNSQQTKSSFSVSLPLETELRYGENPHQQARLYGHFDSLFHQFNGKALSYTNILDIEAASGLILEFGQPAVGILKHTNPCGVGVDDENLRAAWQKAFETDKQAPFGGVIVCNRPLTMELARVIGEIFTDVIIAPAYEADARAYLQKKKNLRLILMRPGAESALRAPIFRSVPGGMLTQDSDPTALGLKDLEKNVLTRRPPTETELKALRFAWRVCKHVKSNAIVFASADRTLGIGAGQMSRVDSCRIAVWKAKEAGLSLKSSAVASDAMFPFADGLIAAADAGASCCIQPGGSVRDAEVVAAADERDMAMVVTNHRHFRH